ncbi:Os11g0544951 [Oryza sativa Japonica Group]|uniref:Os11g0544951 protein n=1 Tax=Oryza sativa subsp. japonica TaxID=39947 RepID=A0A0P0Y2Z1_ORYSJ|nr:Os11g0544951 [Oryza sativa Japonica Group]
MAHLASPTSDPTRSPVRGSAPLTSSPTSCSDGSSRGCSSSMSLASPAPSRTRPCRSARLPQEPHASPSPCSPRRGTPPPPRRAPPELFAYIRKLALGLELVGVWFLWALRNAGERLPEGYEARVTGHSVVETGWVP